MGEQRAFPLKNNRDKWINLENIWDRSRAGGRQGSSLDRVKRILLLHALPSLSMSPA